MPNKSLSFVEIRNNFIDGAYKSGSREQRRAGQQLHNLLPSIDDLIPLLEASNESSVYLGAYIAQEEGERAAPLFPILYELFDSEWESVRSEVCNCFIYCRPEPKYLILLLDRPKDPARSVRLGIMHIFYHLSSESLNEILEYASTSNSDIPDDRAGALRVLLASKLRYSQSGGIDTPSSEKLDSEILRRISEGMNDKDQVNVSLCYLACAIHQDWSKNSRSLAKTSGNRNILDYHKTFEV